MKNKERVELFEQAYGRLCLEFGLYYRDDFVVDSESDKMIICLENEEEWLEEEWQP